MNVEAATKSVRPGRYRLLVFRVAGQRYGISSSAVDQIAPLAELHRPPAAPNVLAGFLNLAGEAIAVIRLRHLFGQPDGSVGLWTPLVILRGNDRRLALLVDEVERIVDADGDATLPLPSGHVLNDCVAGVLRSKEDSVLLLSPERLLMQQEARSVAELGQLAQQRLDELEGAKA